MDTKVSQRGAERSRSGSGGSRWGIHQWRFALAIAVGVIAATGWSVFLSWATGLPRISDVSFAAAAERGNTPSTWLVTFAFSAFVVLFVQALITLVVRAFLSGPRRVVR